MFYSTTLISIRSTLSRIMAFGICAVLFLLPQSGTAQIQPVSETDSIQAVETLHAFRDAIISGDRLKAGQEMSEDAIVMQAGQQCDRETYINKHIIPECKYVYSVNQSVDHRILRQRGNLIWISSSYNVKVQHQGDKPVHRKLAELAILRKEKGSWKIDMIHWSDCPRYPNGD